MKLEFSSSQRCLRAFFAFFISFYASFASGVGFPLDPEALKIDGVKFEIVGEPLGEKSSGSGIVWKVKADKNSPAIEGFGSNQSLVVKVGKTSSRQIETDEKVNEVLKGTNLHTVFCRRGDPIGEDEEGSFIFKSFIEGPTFSQWIGALDQTKPKKTEKWKFFKSLNKKKCICECENSIDHTAAGIAYANFITELVRSAIILNDLNSGNIIYRKSDNRWHIIDADPLFDTNIENLQMRKRRAYGHSQFYKLSAVRGVGHLYTFRYQEEALDFYLTSLWCESNRDVSRT